MRRYTKTSLWTAISILAVLLIHLMVTHTVMGEEGLFPGYTAKKVVIESTCGKYTLSLYYHKGDVVFFRLPEQSVPMMKDSHGMYIGNYNNQFILMLYDLDGSYSGYIFEHKIYKHNNNIVNFCFFPAPPMPDEYRDAD